MKEEQLKRRRLKEIEAEALKLYPVNWRHRTPSERVEVFDDGLAQRQAYIAAATKREEEVQELKRLVSDLQTGMYVNCVYCGHRYGKVDNTPVSMADILKQHVEQCPKHPMSQLKKEVERLKKGYEEIVHTTASEVLTDAKKVHRCFKVAELALSSPPKKSITI